MLGSKPHLADDALGAAAVQTAPLWRDASEQKTWSLKGTAMLVVSTGASAARTQSSLAAFLGIIGCGGDCHQRRRAHVGKPGKQNQARKTEACGTAGKRPSHLRRRTKVLQTQQAGQRREGRCVTGPTSWKEVLRPKRYPRQQSPSWSRLQPRPL